MICRNCALGADLITQLWQIDNGYRAKEFISVSEVLHSHCNGCDCQHVIRKSPKDHHTTATTNNAEEPK